MQTIRIILSADKSLLQERMELADLVENLNHSLESRNANILMLVWDSSESNLDSFKDKISETDLCLTLYYDTFYESTQSELETAYQSLCEGKNPQKIYVYFKEGETVPEKLQTFRDCFPTKYGHFYCSFSNIDTLKADFLLQFMEYQSKNLGDNKMLEVNNGKVTIDGKEYVDLKNVPFAGNNEEYNLLLKSIKKTQKLLAITDEDDPDYADYAADLQEMKEKLSKMESSLWDTALLITHLSTTKCSERLKRAMDLFTAGDNKGAQAVLNEEEIERDVEHNLHLLKLGEEGKKGLEININEYLLKIKSIKTSKEINYYSIIIDLYLKVINISEKLYGENDEHTATYYKEIADLYSEWGDLDDALECHSKAMMIRTTLFGEDNIETAESYCNLGSVYRKLGNHQKALEWHIKGYEIREKTCGHLNPNVAYSLGNIAYLYLDIMKYEKALICARECYNILNDYFKGKDNLDIAHASSLLGTCYIYCEDFDNALFYKEKSLSIHKNLMNIDNPIVSLIYQDIGSIYGHKGDYQKSFKYHKLCLDSILKIYGKFHPDVADIYMNVGIDLKKMGKLEEAVDYYNVSLEITERLFGSYSFQVAKIKKNIAYLKKSLGDKENMIAAYKDIVNIYANLEGCDNQLLLQAEYDLSWTYSEIGDYNNSKLHLEKGLDLLDDSSPQALASFFSRLGNVNKQLKDYEDAVECFWKAAEYFWNLEDFENSFCNVKEAAELGDLEACDKLGEMYELGDGVDADYSKAIEWYLKAANHGYEDSYNNIAWTYHLMGKYEEALPWAEKAVIAISDFYSMDTLATIYHDLGRYDEALEQFELCLKLQKEQNASEEDIHETEEKIVSLKELMESKT